MPCWPLLSIDTGYHLTYRLATWQPHQPLTLIGRARRRAPTYGAFWDRLIAASAA